MCLFVCVCAALTLHASVNGWEGVWVCGCACECGVCWVGGVLFFNLVLIRVVSSFFWEQGFDKVRESSRYLEMFEGCDVQFWEMGPWAPPPTFKSSQLVVMFINIYKGKKGLEWDHVIIVEQKKKNLKVQCKCRVV